MLERRLFPTGKTHASSLPMKCTGSENWSFIPMIGRSGRSLDRNGSGASHEIKDMLLQLLYRNKSTGSYIGVIYDRREAPVEANDAPYERAVQNGDSPQTLTSVLRAQQPSSGFSSKATTIYFSRSLFQDWRFQIEGTFLKGETGLLFNEQEVLLSGYGIATEILYKEGESLESGFSGKLKMGLATGDDLKTENTYEAFSFDPNYNVGLLLFNHPLGFYDLFQTSLYRQKREMGPSSPFQCG